MPLSVPFWLPLLMLQTMALRALLGRSTPLLIPMLLRRSFPMSLPMPLPMSIPMSILCCSRALSEQGKVGDRRHFANLKKALNLSVAASSRSESTSAASPEATPATSS